jgi:hypothetical protein
MRNKEAERSTQHNVSSYAIREFLKKEQLLWPKLVGACQVHSEIHRSAISKAYLSHIHWFTETFFCVRNPTAFLAHVDPFECKP